MKEAQLCGTKSLIPGFWVLFRRTRWSSPSVISGPPDRWQPGSYLEERELTSVVNGYGDDVTSEMTEPFLRKLQDEIEDLDPVDCEEVSE